jgi:F-type H+/Na+-transporting ATPase subunit alpha
MMDERTRQIIEHGRRIRAVLTQPQYQPLSVAHQLVLLLALDERLLDQLSLEKVSMLQAKLGAWLSERAAEPVRQINATGELAAGARAALVAATRALVEQLNAADPRLS